MGILIPILTSYFSTCVLFISELMFSFAWKVNLGKIWRYFCREMITLLFCYIQMLRNYLNNTLGKQTKTLNLITKLEQRQKWGVERKEEWAISEWKLPWGFNHGSKTSSCEPDKYAYKLWPTFSAAYKQSTELHFPRLPMHLRNIRGQPFTLKDLSAYFFEIQKLINCLIILGEKYKSTNFETFDWLCSMNTKHKIHAYCSLLFYRKLALIILHYQYYIQRGSEESFYYMDFDHSPTKARFAIRVLRSELDSIWASLRLKVNVTG